MAALNAGQTILEEGCEYFAKVSYGLMKNESYIYTGVKAQELTRYIRSFKMNDNANTLK